MAKMKVLVVGGGGREHALAWKIASSARVSEVICAPGNAGTAGGPQGSQDSQGARDGIMRNADVAATDLAGLVQLAEREEVGLVVIGPEDPLCAGAADRLREAGFPVFGPGADGARLEASKVFTKELLERHRIPTGAYRRFDRAGAAKAYLESCTVWPQVVKADGLAAGKGVVVAADEREARLAVDAIMEQRTFGDAGAQVIIEEFLIGEEVSVLAITDGQAILFLEPVMDHKQVGDGDTGPNTGGMGVISPVSVLGKRVMRQIEQRILLPTLHALRLEEIDFRGVLFAGLMLTEQGPRVLEYNVRFGDPELQAIVRRMKSDLVPYLLAAAEGRLADLQSPEWDERTCVGVVMASEGYPGAYEKGQAIRGLARAAEQEEVVVFHAGTRVGIPAGAGEVRTDGGRVLCVTALGEDAEQARTRAYAGCEEIRWGGAFYRRDIGARQRARPREPSGASD